MTSRISPLPVNTEQGSSRKPSNNLRRSLFGDEDGPLFQLFKRTQELNTAGSLSRFFLPQTFRVRSLKLSSSLRFEDAEMETEFRSWFRGSNLVGTHIGLLCFLIVFSLFGISDVILVEPYYLDSVLYWRFVGLVPATAVVFVASICVDQGYPHRTTILQALYLWHAMVIAICTTYAGYPYLACQFVHVMFTSAVFRLRFWHSLFSTISAAVIHNAVLIAACFVRATPCAGATMIVFHNVVLVFVAAISLGMTFLWEFSLRKDFMVHAAQSNTNKELLSQIAKLETQAQRKEVPGEPNLTTPIEEAIAQLNALRSRGDFDRETAHTLDDILRRLKSRSSLLLPTLPTDQSQDIMEWVVTNLLLENSQQRDPTEGAVRPVIGELDRSLFLFPGLGGLKQVEVDWDFDIFEAGRHCGGYPLREVATALLDQMGLIEKFKIPRENLANFLARMESGYLNNPYHNSMHAADMTMTSCFFIRDGGLEAVLTDIEILGVIVASIIHDLGHPGFTNNFLINSGDDLSIYYNDRSVLENYHCAKAFNTLREKSCDIFVNCTAKQRKDLRKLIIDLVIATDLSQHFEILTKFKTTLLETGPEGKKCVLNEDSPVEDRNLLLKVLIKCGDVSHSCKNTALHKEWSYRITEEFLYQGDQEQARNLPLSPFMDRSVFKMPESQTSFINFIVLPLYEAFTSWMADYSTNIDVCIHNLLANRAMWEHFPQTEAADAGFIEWSEQYRLSRNTTVTVSPSVTPGRVSPRLATTPATPGHGLTPGHTPATPLGGTSTPVLSLSVKLDES